MQTATLLTQAKVARRLGVSRETVRRWTRLGLLPTFVDPESGRVHYPERAIELWEASHFNAGRAS